MLVCGGGRRGDGPEEVDKSQTMASLSIRWKSTVLDGKGSHWRILGVMGLINRFVGQNSFSNPVNCILNYVYDITNILISTGTHLSTQSMTLNQSWVLTSMLQIKRLVVDGILCQKTAAASLSPDLYPMLQRVKELQFPIILKYVQILKASQIS